MSATKSPPRSEVSELARLTSARPPRSLIPFLAVLAVVFVVAMIAQIVEGASSIDQERAARTAAEAGQEIRLGTPELAGSWTDVTPDDGVSVELVSYSSPTDFCLSSTAGGEVAYFAVDRLVESCPGGLAS